jgi:hypothetical protein
MKTALVYGEAVAVIVAVSVPVHYLGELDWPWAIVIGAVALILVRSLIHSGILARLRKRPLIGH